MMPYGMADAVGAGAGFRLPQMGMSPQIRDAMSQWDALSQSRARRVAQQMPSPQTPAPPRPGALPMWNPYAMNQPFSQFRGRAVMPPGGGGFRVHPMLPSFGGPMPAARLNAPQDQGMSQQELMSALYSRNAARGGAMEYSPSATGGVAVNGANELKRIGGGFLPPAAIAAALARQTPGGETGLQIGPRGLVTDQGGNEMDAASLHSALMTRRLANENARIASLRNASAYRNNMRQERGAALRWNAAMGGMINPMMPGAAFAKRDVMNAPFPGADERGMQAFGQAVGGLAGNAPNPMDDPGMKLMMGMAPDLIAQLPPDQRLNAMLALAGGAKNPAAMAAAMRGIGGTIARGNRAIKIPGRGATPDMVAAAQNAGTPDAAFQQLAAEHGRDAAAAAVSQAFPDAGWRPPGQDFWQQTNPMSGQTEDANWWTAAKSMAPAINPGTSLLKSLLWPAGK